MELSWGLVLAAVLPVVVLGGLVVRSVGVARAAWISAAVAAVVGLGVFGLPLSGVWWSLVRGVWTGTWILLIVLPALLLFELLDRSGSLDRLADAADVLAPTEGRRLLLLAFVLPSFLQGAAGFGAPIAMSAPMLVRRGMAPVAAVAACLIGYQWSVTFGSMGSSYFMASATAGLDAVQAADFARRAAVTLALTAVVSALLVLRRGRSLPGDRWRAVVLATVMGATLILTVSIQPALGSTAAGLAGLIAAWWVLPPRGAPKPDGRPLLLAATPYLALTVTATIGFAFPPVRALFEQLPTLAPALPSTATALGYVTTDATLTPAFRPLLHPLPYVLLAIVIAHQTYRRNGWWAPEATREALTSWVRRCRPIIYSLVGLTTLAAILTTAGMITTLATALATALGGATLLLTAPLGALGTVLTGSTTASNALFSGLQSQIAITLGLTPAILLAAQTAGGNIGNALSPAAATVGGSAAGARGREGEILRRNVWGVALLLVVVLVATGVQVVLDAG